jgi:hypothetical protein
MKQNKWNKKAIKKKEKTMAEANKEISVKKHEE